MNRLRRKALDALISNLEAVINKNDLRKCIDTLEGLKSEEEYYYDNIPENLLGSMRADQSQEAIDSMDEAINSLNDACDEEDEDARQEFIDEAIGAIEDAAV